MDYKPASKNQQTRASTHPEFNENKVFIGCLPKDIGLAELELHFSKIVKIVKLEMDTKKNQHDENKMIFAVMTCVNKSMRDKVLSTKHLICEKNVKVSPFLTNQQLDSYVEKAKRCRIYIKKLPKQIENSKLAEIFSMFGKVEKAYSVIGTKVRKKWKYGYVIFSEEEMIDNIPLEGVEYNGQLIKWTSHKRKLEKRVVRELAEESRVGGPGQVEESFKRREERTGSKETKLEDIDRSRGNFNSNRQNIPSKITYYDQNINLVYQNLNGNNLTGEEIRKDRLRSSRVCHVKNNFETCDNEYNQYQEGSRPSMVGSQRRTQREMGQFFDRNCLEHQSSKGNFLHNDGFHQNQNSIYPTNSEIELNRWRKSGRPRRGNFPQNLAGNDSNQDLESTQHKEVSYERRAKRIHYVNHIHYVRFTDEINSSNFFQSPTKLGHFDMHQRREIIEANHQPQNLKIEKKFKFDFPHSILTGNFGKKKISNILKKDKFCQFYGIEENQKNQFFRF